jgi:hypothetical protein
MKKQEMINAFMKKTNAVLLEKGNRTIVSYDEPRNVVVWVGKQRKPVYHYIFDLEERRQLFISKQTEFGLTDMSRPTLIFTLFWRESQRVLFFKWLDRTKRMMGLITANVLQM